MTESSIRWMVTEGASRKLSLAVFNRDACGSSARTNRNGMRASFSRPGEAGAAPGQDHAARLDLRGRDRRLCQRLRVRQAVQDRVLARRARRVRAGNPALLFLYGRLNGTSAGALAAWRYGVWGALFAALMSVFIVIRHSRADEEAGRLELIGSARVGRQAPLVSAIGVAALANVVIAAVLCVVLPLLGLPAAGRWRCRWRSAPAGWRSPASPR